MIKEKYLGSGKTDMEVAEYVAFYIDGVASLLSETAPIFQRACLPEFLHADVGRRVEKTLQLLSALSGPIDNRFTNLCDGAILLGLNLEPYSLYVVGSCGNARKNGTILMKYPDNEKSDFFEVIDKNEVRVISRAGFSEQELEPDPVMMLLNSEITDPPRPNSCMIVPLYYACDPIGVVTLYSTIEDYFDQIELGLVVMVTLGYSHLLRVIQEKFYPFVHIFQ